MATKLYPPLIEETLPAFCKQGNNYVVTVPFAMNKTVGYEIISGFSLILKNVLGGMSVLKTNKETSIYDRETNTAIFTITEDDINNSSPIYEGSFYKAQIAYISKIDHIIGYYSTVGVVKCIEKPEVLIEGLSVNNINIFSTSYIGKYKQNSSIGDTSEKVYSYEFNIYDNKYNLFATSGIQVHDASTDEVENMSIDTFYTYKDIQKYETYYLQYSVTTVNKFHINSPFYHLTAVDTIDIENPLEIIPINNFEDGYIAITFKADPEADYTGMYLITKSADNGNTWEEVQRFIVDLDDKHIHTHVIKDYLIEQGKEYLYSIQEFNRHEVYTNRIISQPIYADYEDMYLSDKNRILKIRFNPKVASFKIDIPEQKTDTIGSKYPYFFRNGVVYYKEFPVAGLLSFNLETALEFLTPAEQEESGIWDIIDHRKYTERFASKEYITQAHEKYGYKVNILDRDALISSTKGQLNMWQRQRVENHISKDIKKTRFSTNLTSDNLYTERYFKLKVLEWLNNGQPKLFRSPTEGLYIVRLLNISLTPEDKLGRMIHNFTSTAYEVADIDLQTLYNLNLVQAVTSNTFLQTYTNKDSIQDLFPDIFNPNGASLLSLLGSYIKELHFTDCCPGDIVIVKFSDGTSSEFRIGAGHELHITDEERSILDVIFIANTEYNSYSAYRRYLERTYMDAVNTSFDQYTNISSAALPCLGLVYNPKTIIYNEENWHRNGNTWQASIDDLSTSVCTPAVFDATMLGTSITTNTLNKYLGYSFYIDKAHTKPKILIKHIDQIIITKRQIIPVYQNGTSNEYAVNIFGKGFINDRYLTQTITIDSNTQLPHVEFDTHGYEDLTFNKMVEKNNLDVYTFNGLMNNFKDDRFTILQLYHLVGTKWVPNGENCYYIPNENIQRFQLEANDWVYKINNESFKAIPNSFIEGQPDAETLNTIINTSTYVKVIDVDRFKDEKIPCIFAGRGVCIDIVPQCIVYDYLIEDTNTNINIAKNTYLENRTLNNLYRYLQSLNEANL